MTKAELQQAIYESKRERLDVEEEWDRCTDKCDTHGAARARRRLDEIDAQIRDLENRILQP